MKKVYVAAQGRSAIGKYQGTLSQCDPFDICRQVISGMADTKMLADVDAAVFGSVLTGGMGQGPARRLALLAGVPESVPAYLVSMVCGSGMQAIRSAIGEIACGSHAVLCGGFEFMSQAPYLASGRMRSGTKMGDLTLRDMMLLDGLTDAMSNVHMGITAENVADLLDISRETQDAYAFEAIQRAISAVDRGAFHKEIIPVTIPQRRGQTLVFDKDEYPNRESTLEKLSRLRPAFKEGGTVTAGNSSGLNDGCAFLILADEEWCQSHDVQPMFEIVDTASAGCNPQTMGLGPVYAISRLLEQQKMSLGDIPCLELNEAFAAQALGCLRMLSQQWGISEEQLLSRTNLWGSGIGLGHPLGMSGARLPITLMSRMAEEDSELGLASLCVGGGMGLATLIRRVQ